MAVIIISKKCFFETSDVVLYKIWFWERLVRGVVVKFVVVSRVQFCLLREKTEKRLGVGSLAERGIRSKSRHWVQII